MSHDAHIASHCRNCGTSLNLQPRPKFCPQCGQETVLHPPTFFEFVHEFVGHYIALEGALWRTLISLLLKPGKLTSEYFAGRRRQYVLPLRLYLSASFVFFVLVKAVGLGSSVNFTVGGAVDARGRPLPSAASTEVSASMKEAQACVARTSPCGWFERQAAKVRVKAAETSRDPAAFQRRIQSMAPYTVFVLLPVFAGILKLAYRSRRMNYGAHFVFSLHMHAFWFVALLAMSVSTKWLEDLLALATVGYGVYAMHHVYKGRWWTTGLRALAISVSYGILFVVGVLGMVLLSLLL